MEIQGGMKERVEEGNQGVRAATKEGEGMGIQIGVMEEKVAKESEGEGR